MELLCGIYLLGCSFRAVFPRIDVERVCYYGWWFNAPLVGRIFATAAELSFMAQLAMALYRIADDLSQLNPSPSEQTLLPWIRRFAKLAFFVNIVAQCFCWMGVTTTRQVWHVYEESIWAGTVLFMTIFCAMMYKQLNKIKHLKSISPSNLQNTQTYLRWSLVSGPIYVAYMVTVDIPMYYYRWKQDEERGRQYYSIGDGVRDASQCKVVTQDYEAWREDLSWITLYFSVAVWASIWLTRAPRLIDTQEKTKAQ